MLEKIKIEELIFSNEIEDDRTNTYLTLDDYDWMNYKLQTRFKTELQGVLNVLFNYFGLTTSSMKVEQIKNGESKKYNYEYSTDIFEKYLKKYLEKHISQWNDRYAFNGEEIVVEFYNEIIEKGTLVNKEPEFHIIK